MTHQNHSSSPPSAFSPHARRRPDASRAARAPGRARARPREPGLRLACWALICAGGLCAQPADARTTKPRSQAASTPSTAQILAPSAATTPDALPPERTVYRCGNAYSGRPCADAKPLDVSDARSAEQRAQAEDVAARGKRLASWLEAGRRDRERVASEPRNGHPTRPPAAGCAKTGAVACPPKKPPPPRVAVSLPASGAAKGKPK